MRSTLADLAFEMGLIGLAAALFHYGLAVRSLNRLIRSKSPIWAGAWAGALVFVAVAALHAWGRFALFPRLAGLETKITEATAGLRLSELDLLQARFDEILSLMGNLRALSFAGVLLGSLLALAAGASFLRATSK